MGTTRSAKTRDGGAAQRANRIGDERIYHELTQAIIDHRIPPGTPLPEDTLAGAFGVSRTVVRKALLRLGHDKLVELRPNRGAAVARPSVDEARQLFEARRVIEPALLQAAVAGIDAAAFARLRANVAEEREAYARGDRRSGILLSGEFHRCLAECSGNAVLAEFLGELVSRTSLVIALYQLPGVAPCSLEEHAELLQAIERRDAEAAVRLMRHHLEHCERQLDLSEAGRGVDLRALFAPAAEGAQKAS